MRKSEADRMKMKKEFPEGFLWGASTSACQVEGAAYEDGKKASQQDVINRENYEKHGFANADIASDHYHHFKVKPEYILTKEAFYNNLHKVYFCCRSQPDKRALLRYWYPVKNSHFSGERDQTDV